MTKVILRDTTEADLPLFFEWQRDPVANRMAAFTAKDPTDREAFTAHWTKILRDDAIIKETILFGGRAIGSIARFEWLGKPNVTYWIGREYWGRGFATQGLSRFLQDVKTRPLYASAAKDNLASIRVLQKCGARLPASQRPLRTPGAKRSKKRRWN